MFRFTIRLTVADGGGGLGFAAAEPISVAPRFGVR
jgi:hypothetical protein